MQGWDDEIDDAPLKQKGDGHYCQGAATRPKRVVCGQEVTGDVAGCKFTGCDMNRAITEDAC